MIAELNLCQRSYSFSRPNPHPALRFNDCQKYAKSDYPFIRVTNSAQCVSADFFVDFGNYRERFVLASSDCFGTCDNDAKAIKTE